MELLQVASNCTVADENPRTVTIVAGDTAETAFQVACTHAIRGLTGFIAFASSRDGTMEIYLMNADGSEQTRLTNHGGANEVPAISPDGTKILFETFRDGNREVYVMNLDGSEQTNLTNHPGYDSRPRWSPDGTQIAVSSNRSGAYEIYVMNADGSDPVAITNNPHAADFAPAWSPDGTRIAETAREPQRRSREQLRREQHLVVDRTSGSPAAVALLAFDSAAP